MEILKFKLKIWIHNVTINLSEIHKLICHENYKYQI